MERLKKQLRVIRMDVLSIVDGETSVDGLRARKLAEEEKKHVPDQKLLRHQTEVKNVKVCPRRQMLVIHRLVQLIANGDHSVVGLRAQKLVEEEKKHAPDQNLLWHQTEVENV